MDNQNHWSDSKRLKIKKILSLTAVILVLGLFTFITIKVGKPLVTTASDPQQFRDWIKSKGVWAQGLMVALMMLQVVVSLIPGEPFELGAGYAFGVFEGLVLCLLGALIASTLIFLAVRRFGMPLLTLFFEEKKIRALPIFKNEKKLEFLVFLLFMIPGVPKDLVTYAVGLTDIPLSRFLLLSTIGRIPSVITSTLTGHFLGQGSLKYAIIVYGITLLLTVAGIVYYRKKFPREPKDEPKDEGGAA